MSTISRKIETLAQVARRLLSKAPVRRLGSKAPAQGLGRTTLLQQFCHTTLALVLCCCLCVSSLPFSLISLQRAWADTTETEAELSELQQLVEETAAAYNEATERIAELEEQIAENEATIAELEERIPEQQQISADAVGSLYKLQKDGLSLISVLLNAGSFADFLSGCVYLSRIFDNATNELAELDAMITELDETQKALDEALQEAQTEQIRAEDALREAQEAREEAQRAAEEAAAAEAAEAAAAEEAESASSDQTSSGSSSSSSSSGSSSSSSGLTSSVDWSLDKQAFVEEWGARIDAYLAGSPLAGYGATFAAAAWDYGVDPRWSPAIAHTESTKGLYCSYPYNAWGWGTYSWSSWEEAIYAHVSGLARGYGYTISVAAAQKYCPYNWEHWYTTTLAQMNLI